MRGFGMSHWPHSLPTLAPTPEACGPDTVVVAGAGSPQVPGSAIPPQIAWLFRRALAQGQLHPLMPHLMHYRKSQRGEGPA
jgi:hypothetical protein